MLSILDIVSANTIYYCYPALVPTSKRVYGDSMLFLKIQIGNSHTNCIACEFAHEKNYVHVLKLLRRIHRKEKRWLDFYIFYCTT